MDTVREESKEIALQSKFITINYDAMTALAEKITEDDLHSNDNGLWRYDTWSLEEQMNIILVFNSINYCFWAGKGEEKWNVIFDAKKEDGSSALMRCVEEYFFEDRSRLKAKSLKKFSEDDFVVLLKNSTSIPLFDERITCIQELGNVLETEFDGDFKNFYERSEYDAVKMVALLVEKFPRFNDYSLYLGKEIPFYKRAQLNAKMIHDLFIFNCEPGLKNLDKLTAFADYKVPQILRSLGILKYSPGLSEKIENYEIIEKDSLEEVEIRANTIHAIEEFKEILKPKFSFVTAAHIDHMLWWFSQTKTPDERPYHRTFTIAY